MEIDYPIPPNKSIIFYFPNNSNVYFKDILGAECPGEASETSSDEGGYCYALNIKYNLFYN